MAASQAKANDPHLLTELEQLRTLRDKYENTLAEININNSNLKNQINQQTDEISSIKNQLSSSSDKVSQLSSSNANLEKALAAKSEEIQNVTAELKNLKSKPQEPAILNNNNINVAAIEEELANVKKSLATKETEVVRLNGEITTLQEKVNNWFLILRVDVDLKCILARFGPSSYKSKLPCLFLISHARYYQFVVLFTL